MRYLGDLNGGQILARLVGESLGLGAEALAFHTFPHLPDPPRAATALREAMNAIVLPPALDEAMVAEVLAAFRFNIALSEAVGNGRDMAPQTPAPA